MLNLELIKIIVLSFTAVIELLAQIFIMFHSTF